MHPVNHILLDLFRAHDIDATINVDGITFPGIDIRASADVVSIRKQNYGISCQLDIRFALASGRVITESFAGLGTTNEEALGNAFENFAVNSFHVFVAAFLQPGDDHVDHEEWIIGGRMRRVTIGNFGTRGSQPSGTSWPDECMALIERHIKSTVLDRSTHWFRLYYGQHGGESLSCEALLDNAPWIQFHADLVKLPWPADPDFYSVRLFLILAGEDTAPAPLSPPTAVNTPGAAVDYLARLLASRPGLNQTDAYDSMVAAGIPIDLTDRAYRFTQVAWGRAYLDGLGVGFAPDYFFFDPNGKVIESGLLADNPFYQAAIKLVPQYKGAPAFNAIAPWSADVDMVSNFVNKGSSPADLRTTSVVFFIGAPTDAGIAEIQRLISQQAKANMPQAAPPVHSPRAWWQFWKP